jgi:hypothetical protein
MPTDSKIQVPYSIPKWLFTRMTEDPNIFLNIHIKMLYKTAFGRETFFVSVTTENFCLRTGVLCCSNNKVK